MSKLGAATDAVQCSNTLHNGKLVIAYYVNVSSTFNIKGIDNYDNAGTGVAGEAG